MEWVSGMARTRFKMDKFLTGVDRHGVAREEGGTLVEFALVLVLFLTVLFGIMEFSRFMYTYHFVSNAAREATRYAVVRGSTWKATSCGGVTSTLCCDAAGTDVTDFVTSITPPGITSDSLTVTTTWPGTAPSGAKGKCTTTNGVNSPGCLVEVEVSYPFTFILPFISKSTFTLESTSEMVITQ
jgi:Flp pilus assembly protein TadG